MNKFANIFQYIDSFYFFSTAKKEDKVYGPYTLASGRKIVILIDSKGNKRTVSYPKYIMEKHLNRVLDPDKETVQHLDGDYNNNDINNLSLLPRHEHSAQDTKRVKKNKLKCSMCKKTFERASRLIRDRAKKKQSGPFCSRRCAGRYSRLLQLKLIKKLPVQPLLKSKYYTLRDSKATFILEICKFGNINKILTLKQQLINLIPVIIEKAQKIIDEWDQIEGYDLEFGYGGICDQISEEIAKVVSDLPGVEVDEGGQPGDDHAYIVVFNDFEAYVVDIPHHLYESGGGYSWKKKNNVSLKNSDVLIEKIDRKLIDR